MNDVPALPPLLPDGMFLSAVFAQGRGFNADVQAKLLQHFNAFSVRCYGFGLTHWFYRAVYADPDQGEIGVCDMMVGPREFIDKYYAHNLGPMFSSMCQSQRPYALTFFPKPEAFLAKKYADLIPLTIQHGMLYDFLFHFRDCPMSGGGCSGGRAHEKLDKPTLYAVLGTAIEFHKLMNVELGKAAEESLALTDNELKYLQLLFYGLSQKDIASASKVSSNWVAKVCMNTRRKLGVRSDAGAVAKAVGLNILR